MSTMPGWLKDAIQQRKISDLHSDLMGAASWEFWVNKVMKDVIPKLVTAKKVEWYRDLEYITFDNAMDQVPTTKLCQSDEPSVDFITARMINHCDQALRAKLKDGYRNFYFTHDVVYSNERLMQAFNDERVDYVAWTLGTDAGEFTRAPYIVWNAKRQMFEERQGITNSRLLQLIEKKNGGSLAPLANCFTVLDSRGDQPSKSVIIGLFNRVPNSKIYMMQHALKESMCEQYLEIIDELIDHLVKDVCIPSGVGYVEFSVAHSFITKPWVFKHLYDAMIKHSRDVTIRYLINFQQNDELTPTIQDVVKDRLNLDSLLNLSADEYRAHMQGICQDKGIFGKSLMLLDELKGRLTDAMAAQKFMHAVVGLDYTGDKEHPFCPFGLTEFTEFVKTCRIHHNERFGFNFHCNKFNVDPELPNDHVYMLIIAQIIQNILNAFPNGVPSPLRMGQTIGFLEFQERIKMSDRFLGPIDREMVSTFKLMHNRHVILGVNLKTNELATAYGKDPKDLVQRFRNMGFSVVLCSDSDGVWNSAEILDGKTYRSATAGFIHMVRTDSLLDETFGYQLINNTAGKFEDRSYRRRANSELYAKSASSGGIQFIQNVTPEMAKAAIQMTGEPSKATKPNQLLENLRKQVATAQKQYIE